MPQVDLAEEPVPPAGGTPIGPESFARRFHLSPNEPGWLLLDQGAAMRVSLGGARKIAIPRCEPSGSSVVFVGAVTPHGRTGIAFAREAPSSWRSAPAAPTVPVAEVRAKVDQGLAELGGTSPTSWVVASPEGWFARYAARTGDGWAVVDHSYQKWYINK